MSTLTITTVSVLTFPRLRYFLMEAGFIDVTRVERCGLFDNTSNSEWRGFPIALSVTASRGSR